LSSANKYLIDTVETDSTIHKNLSERYLPKMKRVAIFIERPEEEEKVCKRLKTN